MNKTGIVKKEHNCLVVSLSGTQTYVKVFEASGRLIRHSRTQGATEIQQIVPPGKYRIETDGMIKSCSSTHSDLSTLETSVGR